MAKLPINVYPFQSCFKEPENDHKAMNIKINMLYPGIFMAKNNLEIIVQLINIFDQLLTC